MKQRTTLVSGTNLGDTPWRQLPPETTPYRKYPGDKTTPRLGVLTLTDRRRGVLTLTLTLTDPRGGELSEN